jgi:acid phosphatase type 7
MDVAAAVPVPRVTGPEISAPRVARDPRGLVPPSRPPSTPEPLVMEAIDRIPDGLPAFATEGLFSAVRGAHRLLFGRSDTPASPDVPRADGSWNFTAIGDFGSGRKPLTDVARNIAAGKPELIVTTGDNVYYDGTEAEYARKWDPENMFGSLRENFPVLPSLGNHDTRVSAAPYFRRFPELEKARFYSYDHKNVHFASLNTNESLAPGSPQLKWLEQDLAASPQDWKVVYLHHPLRPGYPGDSAPHHAHLAPVLAKYGVDLVLSGHAHNYTRSKPMNEGGTMEVITGGGGQSLHPFVSRQPGHIAYRDVDFGHLEVEVRPDALVGRYVVRDGTVRDTFVLPNLTPGTPAAATADAQAGAAQVADAPNRAAEPVPRGG